MACPSVSNLCRVRGDTSSITVTLTSDGTTPIDLTGASGLLTVDPSPAPANSDNNLFQLAAVIATPANGQMVFTPSGPQADQTPGTYFYDVQYTDSGGTVITVLKGEFAIEQDITK